MGRTILRLGRLAVALALTAALAPCWVMLLGRSLELPTGFPLWAYVAGIAGVSAVVMLLTWRVFATRPSAWAAAATAAAVYFGGVVAVLHFYAGPGMPFWQLAVVLGAASAWAYWCAWGLVIAEHWSLRLGGLVVLVALGLLLPSLLKLEGLTGDAKVRFVWAGSEEPRQAVDEATETLTEGWLTEPLVLTESDWPEFLGNRQANHPDRRIRTAWDERPPEEVWRREVGLGWGSFAVVGPVAITQEQRGDEECVCCYDLATGEPRWVYRVSTRFASVLGGDGPRATPTMHDQAVYAIGGTGHLACLDVATGKQRWQVDTLADNGGSIAHHGVCGSPLIVDDLVVVMPTGRAEASLVAYDRETGERRWRAGRWKASYSSPMLAEIQGQRQILAFTSDGVEAHAVGDGSLLWSHAFTNDQSTVCAQPVLVHGTDRQILLGLGYGRGSTLIDVSQNDDGGWQTDEVWTSRDMKTKFTTAVIHEGHAYGLDDGILSCIDLATGKRQWKKGRYQHGQVLLVGGWLLIQAEAGDLVLVKPSPEGLEEVGRIEALSDKTWNNPALTSEYLLLRNSSEAVCLRIDE